MIPVEKLGAKKGASSLSRSQNCLTIIRAIRKIAGQSPHSELVVAAAPRYPPEVSPLVPIFPA